MHTFTQMESRLGANTWTRFYLQVLGVTAAMVIAAHIKAPVPWSPVPITLQTFVVLAAGFLVAPSRASCGIAVYLLLGMLGAPVLAATSFATLGYLVAFLAAPFIVVRFPSPAAGIIAASLFIYALGSLWLVLVGDVGWVKVIEAGVAPFLLGDAMKAAAAYGVARLARDGRL